MIGQRDTTAILLSGGTALGAVQVYPLEQLFASGVRPSFVAGVSAGANNAVAVGQWQPERLRPRWRAITGTESFMSPNDLTQITRGLHDLNPARKVLREEVPKAEWKCETHVGVADYQDDCYRSIRIDTLAHEDAVQAVLASSSQPIIMEWVEVGGHVCFDGGMFHVLPDIEDIQERGITEVHAMFCAPLERTNKKTRKQVNGLVEIAFRSASIWTDRVVRDDLRRLHEWAKLGIMVWVYAHTDRSDAFDASHATIQHRLDVVGKAMWTDRRLLQR